MVSSETRRQLLHMGVLAFALPVPFLGPRGAVLLSGLAVIANWFVLPLTPLERSLRREGEPFVNGVRLYPVAVLALFLALPLTLAQGAFAVLAVGDGFSNILGRRYGRVKLPWHAKKSWAGTIGFAVTAAPAALLAMIYTDRFGPAQALLPAWHGSPALGPFALGAAAAIAVAGGVVAALFESLDLPLDDNLSVALGAGAIMAAVALLAL